MLKRFICDATGATAIEYALIAGMLAVSIAGSMTFLGGEYGNLYESIKNVVVASAPAPAAP